MLNAQLLKETGDNKIPNNLFDNEACLYNFESPLTPKSLQMVTAATKLKDIYSLEENV